MCGIVGAVVLDGGSFEITASYLNQMRDAMRHRGPDGAGTWISPDGRVGLGHRRLAIIDLTPSAAQPMCNEDGTLWISFNGEIYNHAEIRAELEALGGHRWKTSHSDTEVILHAFEQWGVDCLQKFRGMFAIALWDTRARQLWLIRDRIGVKPLYYSLHHGRLTFASEIKALLCDPDQRRSVNEQSLFHYLSFVTTPAPDTMFEGIKKLPPATCLRIDANGRIQESRYWDVWDHTQPLVGVSEEEIVERVLTGLRTAVKLRKVSDVPIGVFLSGGVDSSTNTALFSEAERQPVKTFTVGYHGAHANCANEMGYARQVAELFGAQYHERLLSEDDLLDFLPQMIHLQDEPISDPVCVPLYYLSQLARDNGVVVCQVGEGADELFHGYPGWNRLLRFQRVMGGPLQGAKAALLQFGLRWAGRSNAWLDERLRRSRRGEPIFWSGGGEAFTQQQKEQLLSPRLRRCFAGRTSWSAIEPIWRNFREKAWDQSPLNWMTYLDLQLRLPEILLMRVDKMSMGVGLEARVPYLDHELVELAMSIPAKVKAGRGELKRLLKQAVHGLLPDSIIHRRKQGFGVPIHDWFLHRLGERTRRELMAFCAETDFFDARQVQRLLDQGQSQQAWYLLGFALWWKQFIGAIPSRRRPSHPGYDDARVGIAAHRAR